MFVLPKDTQDLRFPPVDLASPEGLLAIGGDLRIERIIEAYQHGIFPWYSKEQPILWWSPDPRSVLFPENLKIARSLRKVIKKRKFEVTINKAFKQVIKACVRPRPQYPDGDTWITEEMYQAYCELHDSGYAHSIESWLDGKLVGGLYGVALGRVFFGESMFSTSTDASKVAFVHLVRQLQAWKFTMIDCQIHSKHLEKFGAKEIRRTEFIDTLDEALTYCRYQDSWQFDEGLVIIE